MKVVVGLGNPGAKYERTRHNVGFQVIEELGRRLHTTKPKACFESQTAEGSLGAEKVLLVAPQTYMNDSGRAVRQLVDFFQLSPGDLLIVCDDFNLDLARLRLRGSGSAGGQKGLADIIRHLGTEAVPRLRIGIGHPPEQMDAADFVLSRFKKGELATVDDMVIRATEGVERWIQSGLDKAMNQVNGRAED